VLYPLELRAQNPFHFTGFISGRGGEIRTPDPLLPKQLRYQAALHPDECILDDITTCIYGAPGEIRTPDLLVRSQTLYPTELRAHMFLLTQHR
jgi:hypothetical protein